MFMSYKYSNSRGTGLLNHWVVKDVARILRKGGGSRSKVVHANKLLIRVLLSVRLHGSRGG